MILANTFRKPLPAALRLRGVWAAIVCTLLLLSIATTGASAADVGFVTADTEALTKAFAAQDGKDWAGAKALVM